MLGLPLAFASPLVLFALAALPALWWLLRLVPPRPRRVQFPPTRILIDIAPKEETPSRSPWWLTALRLLLAALIILAMAGPLWNPPATTSGARGPVLLLIDDGWPAAAAFEQRLRVANQIIASAESASRPVAFATTARPAIMIGIETPSSVRERLRSLEPSPHTPDRSGVLPALGRFLAAQPQAEIIWLTDGIDTGRSQAFLTQLKEAVGSHALTVYDGGTPPVLALTGATNTSGGFNAQVIRADPGPAQVGRVRALDTRGLPIGESTYAFEPGKTEAEVRFDLPVEIRNDITRLDIIGERSAGAVQLVDARWQRRTIGVISGATADTAQPLLSPTYYLGRALEPFADIRTVEGASPSEAAIRFVEGRVPMIVLTDVGTVTAEARDALNRFIDNGGILLRFAGTRLAGAQNDDLVPVKLRRGGR
ncbi:MAG: BatA domain-containing protein, partial [Phreatobacter sp.]